MTIATPTTSASRQPMLTSTSSTTAVVAKSTLADQRVGFGLGGDAVVPGHRHLDPSRDQPVLQNLDPRLHPLGHIDRVLAWLLCRWPGSLPDSCQIPCPIQLRLVGVS